MTAREWSRAGLVGVVAALVLPTAVATAQEGDRSFAMGLTYWPATGSSTSIADVKSRLAPVTAHSDVVQVIIPWCPDGGAMTDFGWLQTVADGTARLGIAIDWLGDDREGVRCRQSDSWAFANDTAANEFVRRAADFVARYHPDYLLLGVEADYYAVTSPKDFPHFVDAFVRARDTVKALAPRTLVGISFQYEHSTWLPGSSSNLLADMFAVFGEPSDFVGLSVYPFQQGFEVEEIGTNYFAQLRNIDEPLAIIETGWPGRERAQGAYVERLLSAADEFGLRLVVWTAGGDVPPAVLRPGTPEWAAEIGLWGLGGEPKPALSVWRSWLGRSWSGLGL